MLYLLVFHSDLGVKLTVFCKHDANSYAKKHNVGVSRGSHDALPWISAASPQRGTHLTTLNDDFTRLLRDATGS